MNVSVQSSFHQMHSLPALLALSAGCQQASLPAHGHPPAPRVLAEAADGEPGVPQAPQQDVPTGFPRKSHRAGQAVPGTASRFMHTSPSQQMHVLTATHPCSQALLCKLPCTPCVSWRYAHTHPCPCKSLSARSQQHTFPPTMHVRISSPMSLLHVPICILLCKSPGLHMPSLTSAHT